MTIKLRHHSKAVTLVEMIIVIGLIAILVGIMSAAIRQMNISFLLHRQANEATWQARLALFRLERELTETTGLVSGGSSTTQIRFTSPQSGNTVRYQRASTTLRRKDGNGNWRAIAQNVSSFTVSWLDSSFASTSTIGNVRCININLTINYEQQTTGLSSTVCPRNLL